MLKEFMARLYSFPAEIQGTLNKIFSHNGWSWNPRQLAQDIIQLSDFYIQNPASITPWEKPWAQRALLTYYWPLNTLRFQAVMDELKRLKFLRGLTHAIDFGAGPATAAHVLKDFFSSIDVVERSTVPQSWFPDFNWTSKIQAGPKSCTVFCYSMTEMASLPEWALRSEALIIVEPAIHQDGRKLLQTRQYLLEKGYSAWAPCPHQQACPLLLNSKTDWCHDRIEVQAPPWFLEIEDHLPIKNKTLTMSYLAMRKAPAPLVKWSRITGDRLEEKGKTRQLICRGTAREFLSWLHRDGAAPHFLRGDRVVLESFDNKSNELRVKKINRVESD